MVSKRAKVTFVFVGLQGRVLNIRPHYLLIYLFFLFIFFYSSNVNLQFGRVMWFLTWMVIEGVRCANILRILRNTLLHILHEVENKGKENAKIGKKSKLQHYSRRRPTLIHPTLLHLRQFVFYVLDNVLKIVRLNHVKAYLSWEHIHRSVSHAKLISAFFFYFS